MIYSFSQKYFFTFLYFYIEKYFTINFGLIYCVTIGEEFSVKSSVRRTMLPKKQPRNVEGRDERRFDHTLHSDSAEAT